MFNFFKKRHICNYKIIEKYRLQLWSKQDKSDSFSALITKEQCECGNIKYYQYQNASGRIEIYEGNYILWSTAPSKER